MKGVIIMKRIVSCFLSSVLMFSFIGCFGKNFDVNSDVFNIKKAGEIASNYMENVTRGNFDESNKISTEVIKDNEEIRKIQNDNINGYKLDKLSEGADHAYFTYIVVKEEKDESRIDLDTVVIKVVKKDKEYLVN